MRRPEISGRRISPNPSVARLAVSGADVATDDRGPDLRSAASAIQNSEMTRPTPPTIIRIRPTVCRLMPFVVTVTAKRRIAPTAIPPPRSGQASCLDPCSCASIRFRSCDARYNDHFNRICLVTWIRCLTVRFDQVADG